MMSTKLKWLLITLLTGVLQLQPSAADVSGDIKLLAPLKVEFKTKVDDIFAAPTGPKHLAEMVASSLKSNERYKNLVVNSSKEVVDKVVKLMDHLEIATTVSTNTNLMPVSQPEQDFINDLEAQLQKSESMPPEPQKIKFKANTSETMDALFDGKDPGRRKSTEKLWTRENDNSTFVVDLADIIDEIVLQCIQRDCIEVEKIFEGRDHLKPGFLSKLWSYVSKWSSSNHQLAKEELTRLYKLRMQVFFYKAFFKEILKKIQLLAKNTLPPSPPPTLPPTPLPTPLPTEAPTNGSQYELYAVGVLLTVGIVAIVAMISKRDKPATALSNPTADVSTQSIRQYSLEMTVIVVSILLLAAFAGGIFWWLKKRRQAKKKRKKKNKRQSKKQSKEQSKKPSKKQGKKQSRIPFSVESKVDNKPSNAGSPVFSALGKKVSPSSKASSFMPRSSLLKGHSTGIASSGGFSRSPSSTNSIGGPTFSRGLTLKKFAKKFVTSPACGSTRSSPTEQSSGTTLSAKMPLNKQSKASNTGKEKTVSLGWQPGASNTTKTAKTAKINDSDPTNVSESLLICTSVNLSDTSKK